ncbi:MAG: hypothetical protein MPN21_04540 [Thermoanaerobaculia bacterium]|nr:hypothetical protein [Thermoanaerobaculia bacterium]
MSDDREHPDIQLVTVFETSDPDMVPIVKSILDGAEIPYSLEGSSIVDLFPAQPMQPIFTDHKGELKVEVPSDRAEEATALLSQDFETYQMVEEGD